MSENYDDLHLRAKCFQIAVEHSKEHRKDKVELGGQIMKDARYIYDLITEHWEEK